MQSMSPVQVRNFLRGVKLRAVPAPSNVPRVGNPPADGSASGYWSKWGSVQKGDPNTFPGGEWLPIGLGYDDTTVFNGTNGAATPADAPSFGPTAAVGNMPEGATPYVSSAVFTPFPFTIGTASNPVSPIIIPKNPSRAALLVQNLSGVTNLLINFGAPANLNLGFIIVPGGAALFDQFTPTNDIYAFFNNAAPQSGVIFEGTRDF